MSNKKISDLTAIATLSSTDLRETSLNGLGSRKETRAQETIYMNANLFSPQNQVYASTNGDNTAGTGRGNFSNPYADPFAATTATTGTSTNPKIINIAPGIYTSTDFSIKPLVSYSGTKFSPMIVTNPIILDSTWASISNASITFFYGISLSGSAVLDFSSATPTSLGLSFLDSYMGGAFSITGQDSNQVNFIGDNVSFQSGVTVKSCIFYCENSTFQSDITIDDKGSGSGTTTVTILGSYIVGNISVSAASGRATTLIIKGSPTLGSLTVDTAFVTVTIDEASYPVGGIAYTNGATSAQMTIVRGDVPGLPSNNAFTGQNGITPAALTSSSNATPWNLTTAPNATYTAVENSVLGSASNQVAGNMYTLKFVQHASAAKTFTFNSNFKFPSGITPIVSTVLSAVDIFTFYSDGTNMRCIGIAQNIS